MTFPKGYSSVKHTFCFLRRHSVQDLMGFGLDLRRLAGCIFILVVRECGVQECPWAVIDRAIRDIRVRSRMCPAAV
jgi:hypothetical protein